MKTTSLFVLSLVALLISCKKPKEVDDGRPRIKSISIAGIPQKDIEFIPERYVINVQLPVVAPEGGFKPTFKLTDNTEFIGGLTANGMFDNTCGGRVLKVANDQKTAIYRNITSYQINFKPAPGCPKPVENRSITYSRGSSSSNFMYINLPVTNAYSDFCVSAITLKDVSTGKQHFYGNILNVSCIGGLCSSGDNRLGVLFSPGWASDKFPSGPGSYEVSIIISCGGDNRTVTFPQPLVFKE